MDAEKIICCDGGNRGLEAAALMNGGMNNWNNNPFIYLVWMMFANRMWGNGEWGNVGNVQTAEIQAQLNALRNQMSDNQNSSLLMDGIKGNAAAINQLAQNLNCDFNTLNACCCDVRNGISQLGGQIGFSAERVINAVQMGDCNLIQALQNCCCQTQQSILKMGYEQQLATCQQTNQFMQRIDVLGNAMQQGFSQVAFQLPSVQILPGKENAHCSVSLHSIRVLLHTGRLYLLIRLNLSY